MSQRHPMVGMTTEARPMMSREPASQKTWGENGRWNRSSPSAPHGRPPSELPLSPLEEGLAEEPGLGFHPGPG